MAILPSSEREVRDSYMFAHENSLSKETTKVIGEEFIHGENYRLLVLEDKVIGIVHRNAAKIIGDGGSNIQDLIAFENQKRTTRLLKPILVDQEVEKKLKFEKLTLESVPEKDREVNLRFNANLSTGGTTEECAGITHQYYKDLAVSAVKAVGLKYGGVDLITPDITQPAKCAINEINYNPGLRPHYKPDQGEIMQVAVPIMEYISKKY